MNKDVRIFFRLEKLKKETFDTKIKDIQVCLDYKKKMKNSNIDYLDTQI